MSISTSKGGHVQYLATPNSQGAEMIHSLSLILIIFGTAAAALALPVVRRSLGQKFDSFSDFFYGDRKVTVQQSDRLVDPTTKDYSANQATSRREIDNFDLSIFEDF